MRWWCGTSSAGSVTLPQGLEQEDLITASWGCAGHRKVPTPGCIRFRDLRRIRAVLDELWARIAVVTLRQSQVRRAHHRPPGRGTWAATEEEVAAAMSISVEDLRQISPTAAI
jgi:hypothetical protein